jgi:hypothetical protein
MRASEPDKEEGTLGNVNYFLREKNNFVISTDPGCLDTDTVFEFLAQAKWWTELTNESLQRALQNSLSAFR